MDVIFIGQAPSKETDGKPPFVGKSGAFLASLMGISQEAMLSRFEFCNVLPTWPGKGINGDKFPIIEAKILAKAMLPRLKNKRVIMLGANVARAFDTRQFTYYNQYQIMDPEHPSKILVPCLVVVPHPSGVNRHWNKPENKLLAQKFFSSLLQHLEKERRLEESQQSPGQDVPIGQQR